MALSYVNGAEAQGASADFDLTLPGSLLEGDLVVIGCGFVGTADGNPGVTTSGYTEIADLYSDDDRDANLAVAWKLMGATPDTIATIKGSGSATNAAVAVCHVWRGADPTTPIDVTTTTDGGIDSAVFNSPSITPVTTGAVVLSIGLSTSTTVDTAITAPTGYTNKVDVTYDPGNAALIGIASKAWLSGAEDPATWTAISTGTPESWAAATVAIRPYIAPVLGKFLQLF